ncbi:MAG: response regulator [Patescibacteria group bacterium]|nr:response regulator [Patescibacteria group bacterium]
MAEPKKTDKSATGMTRVLVVDDEPALVDIYSTAFRAAGYEVVTAADGVEALAAAIQHQPQAVILDIIMPLKDGFDTLRDLKANSRTRHIPVIILSNLGQEFEIKRGLSLGAATFLIKADMEPSTLVMKVQHLLDAASPAPSL